MSSRLSVAHGEIFDLRMRFLGQAKRQSRALDYHLKLKPTMSKKETIKFIVQMIASIATAIVTALGTTSCMGIGA